MDITLDLDSFKALASESRVALLKTLSKRRMTASELATETGLRVQTVAEHLERLETAGLVQRHEEGRKWVYHSLTDKGRAIAAPTHAASKIWVLLGLSVLALFVGGWRLFGTLSTTQYQTVGGVPAAAQAPAISAGAGPMRDVGTATVVGLAPSISLLDLGLIIAGALLLGFVISRVLRK